MKNETNLREYENNCFKKLFNLFHELKMLTINKGEAQVAMYCAFPVMNNS